MPFIGTGPIDLGVILKAALPFSEMFPAENIRHHFIGGVYAKEVRIPAGFVLASHVHRFDHMSILVSGAVSLAVDGETQLYEGPHIFNIRAGAVHTICALSDSVWLCIHATDVVDPDKVDKTLIVEAV